MALRYSKLHRLPFPSYPDLASVAATVDGLGQTCSISWTNGPPGQDPISAVTTHFEYARISATSTTSAVTAAGSVTSASVTLGLPNEDIRVRIRRENSVGFGDWTVGVRIPTNGATA